MNADDGTSLIWGVTMAVLLIGSLAARRLPLGQVMKMVLAWIAIFAGLFVLFSFRAEFGMIWQRVSSEFSGTANQQISGDALILTRGDNGHFSVRASVNGEPADFLVDSGASITSMSGKTATDVGVEFDRASFPVIVSTANGSVKAWRGRIASFEVGNITVDDHDVLVSDNLGDVNLLGMNFLDGLSSYSVTGNEMTLQP